MKPFWIVSICIMFVIILPACKKTENTVPPEDKVLQKAAEDGSVQTAPSAEQREMELLKKVPTVETDVLPEEIDTLTKKQDATDEELERLGLFFVGLNKTRNHILEARKALRKVKKHTRPEAAYWRGMDERSDPRYRFDKKLQDDAVKHIHQAAEAGYIDALKATLEDPNLAMADAVQKLDAYFAQKAEDNRSPKLLYQWARAIEAGPYETAGKKSEQLLKEAAAADYVPAKYAIASSLMADPTNETAWKNGLSAMRDAALAGNPDANSQMAELMMQYKNAPDDMFSKDQKLLLNTFVTQSGKSLDEIIYGYAIAGKGLESSVQTLYGLTESVASEEVSNALVAASIAFMETSASRDACDHLVDDFDWKSLADAGSLSSDQIRKLSDGILKCYNDAIVHGDDYPSETSYYGASTPVVFASFFDGSERPFARTKDDEKSLAYLVFGAHHDLWDAQWRLAQRYETDNALKDHERACFWAKKANQSYFCKTVCKTNSEEIEACTHCKSIKEMSKKCK